MSRATRPKGVRARLIASFEHPVTKDRRRLDNGAAPSVTSIA
jgi:hypothetical protein